MIVTASVWLPKFPAHFQRQDGLTAEGDMMHSWE